MDRNLTEQLKKLSKQLTDAINASHTELNEEEKEDLDIRIADIQDEIWVIEDQLNSEAENEYADHHAKGWN